MNRLIAIDLPGGPALVDALRAVWDAGDAALVLDGRLTVSARHDLMRRFGAAAVIDSSGTTADPSGGRPMEDGDALVVPTSGSTGEPKGAVLTQNALTFNAVNSIAMHDMTSADVIFTNLPMFHVGGLNIQTTPALHAGATVILHRRFEPDATVKVINEEKPTLMILVPALMAAVLQHPGWDDLDLSSLRTINTGSTTVPLSLLDAYQDRGVPIIQVYGSTETAPIVIHQRIPDAWTTRGSTRPRCSAGRRAWRRPRHRR